MQTERNACIHVRAPTHTCTKSSEGGFKTLPLWGGKQNRHGLRSVVNSGACDFPVPWTSPQTTLQDHPGVAGCICFRSVQLGGTSGHFWKVALKVLEPKNTVLDFQALLDFGGSASHALACLHAYLLHYLLSACWSLSPQHCSFLL